jgi:hypothetical protein
MASGLAPLIPQLRWPAYFGEDTTLVVSSECTAGSNQGGRHLIDA